MVEDSLMQCINLPYNVFESGPYTPACEKERVAYSDKLNLMESEPDAQVNFEPCRFLHPTTPSFDVRIEVANLTTDRLLHTAFR
jgi:hypothetical protein